MHKIEIIVEDVADDEIKISARVIEGDPDTFDNSLAAQTCTALLMSLQGAEDLSNAKEVQH